MADGDNNNGHYSRLLDERGCLYGRHLYDKVGEMAEHYDELKQKLDRILVWLVGATLTLGTAALMLGINLVLGWLN